MDLSNDVLAIAKLFLAGVPVKYINLTLSASLRQYIDKSWQQRLLRCTVENPLVLKYPLNSNYQRMFLKSLIEKLEFNELEVLEEIYELYTRLMLSKATNEEYSYKIYYLNQGLNVILKESTSFISQGTTGLVTWQAAKALTEWCLENKDQFNGKNVLELGCGVGLTGIVVCKSCFPCNYRFTDYHPQVLDLLRHNLDVNFNDVCDEVKASALSENVMDIYHWKSTQISLTPFHWDDDAAVEAILQESKPDIILAADVIYDTSIIRCLVKVLKFFLENVTPDKYGSSNTAYIACTLRNEDTLNNFYEEAGHHGIQCEELPSAATQIFLYEASCSMKVLKLFIKA